MQARSFTTNVPKILDLKSSSEQILFRKLSLGAPGSSSQLHISSRGSSLHSSTLACLRARPKPPCCAGYKFIFFCHSLQRWDRQAWKYQVRDSHEKQINGPEGPSEGTVSRKPKIFSSFTQRGEGADRNIPQLPYILCTLTKISV